MFLSLFCHITGENVAFSILLMQTDRKCSMLLHSGRLTSGQFCSTDGKLSCFDVTDRYTICHIYHIYTICHIKQFNQLSAANWVTPTLEPEFMQTTVIFNKHYSWNMSTCQGCWTERNRIPTSLLCSLVWLGSWWGTIESNIITWKCASWYVPPPSHFHSHNSFHMHSCHDALMRTFPNRSEQT